jgi:hypothetical protein
MTLRLAITMTKNSWLAGHHAGNPMRVSWDEMLPGKIVADMYLFATIIASAAGNY